MAMQAEPIEAEGQHDDADQYFHQPEAGIRMCTGMADAVHLLNLYLNFPNATM